MEKKVYSEQLRELQVEIARLQRWVREYGKRHRDCL